MIASEKTHPICFMRVGDTSKPHIPAHTSAQISRISEVVLLATAAALYALHFVHLRADFPNHSAWSDWAKYTDEGWYGLAAIRHYQLGHWNVPGDFNPAAALPIWPLLEIAVFHFTGVSLLAARVLAVSVFGLALLCCYLLLRRWAMDEDKRMYGTDSSTNIPSLAAAIAVLLLAASPFFFAFSRLAILEPLMILLALAGLILARRAGAASVMACEAAGREHFKRRRAILRAAAWCAALGATTAVMVLTKTTGAFLYPAIAWMLWASCSYRLRVFLAAGGIAAVVAGTVWGAYMLLFVRPHYMADYRYLFSANGYTVITKTTFVWVVHHTLLSMNFMGEAVAWMGFMAVIATAAIAARGWRDNALPVSLLLWVLFYLMFLAYHANLQPRYYQAVGVPLIMLIAMAFHWLWRSAMRRTSAAHQAALFPGFHPAARILRLALVTACAAIVFTAARGAVQEITYMRQPEYTFLRAADQVKLAVLRQRAEDEFVGRPPHPEMVLSISGADLSLMTGLPSICDDFGTMTLPERIAAYRPGWYVAWNDVEDDKMEALAPVYRLVRAGAWPALDDPKRNLLVLYRLDPLQERAGQDAAKRR